MVQEAVDSLVAHTREIARPEPCQEVLGVSPQKTSGHGHEGLTGQASTSRQVPAEGACEVDSLDDADEACREELGAEPEEDV